MPTATGGTGCIVINATITATVEHQPYPKPGERNPTVRVGVLDLGARA